MVLPIWIKNWKFSFRSVGEMLLWIVSIVILLPVYGFLWTKKRSGGIGMLYGLAIVPVLLFLMNGISLRHYALVAASLLFMTIENSQSVFSIVSVLHSRMLSFILKAADSLRFFPSDIK